jgi:hypothetical protein
VIYSYPQPVPTDDELDVILPSRPDNSEDPEDGGAEEEEVEEDNPTKPRFIKNGEFHWARDRTRKFWHGKCSWCNGSFRSHRSFRVHRKGTCPEVKKRRVEEMRADPGGSGRAWTEAWYAGGVLGRAGETETTGRAPPLGAA